MDRIRLAYAVQQSTSLYFRADVATWGGLCSEMKSQGMITPDAIPIEKTEGVSGSGQHITKREIAGALMRSHAKPIARPDHEANRQSDDLLASGDASRMDNPGRAALMTMSPRRWEDRWTQWLDFLRRALRPGGFVVR
jgi:hypothetical protein